MMFCSVIGSEVVYFDMADATSWMGHVDFLSGHVVQVFVCCFFRRPLCVDGDSAI